MILICSTDPAVRERWKDNLTQDNKTWDVGEYGAIIDLLKGEQPELLMLHLGLPGLNRSIGIELLRSKYPHLYLFVFSDHPDDPEGLEFLRAGVRGYANTYMDPRVIAKAVDIIRHGEIWVGRKLMMRLIEDAAWVMEAQTKTSQMLAPLTDREQEVALLVARGANNKGIATTLGIAERTVKVHLGTIFGKTNVKDRLQLALLVNGHTPERWTDSGAKSCNDR